MAMNFPDSPSVDDTFTVGDRTWIWNGTTWDSYSLDNFLTSGTAGGALYSAGTAGVFYTDPGTAGQVLTSSGTAADWGDAEDALIGGTSGYTALSAGTAGLSYQPVSHNYVINGAFDIWQRGTSFTTTGTEFVADRWRMTIDQTITRTAFTPGELEVPGFGSSEFYANISYTATGDARLFSRIEDVKTLAGQEVTFSFWAKSSTSNDIITRIAIVQNFGSGGSAVVTTSGTPPTISSSWARYEVTITLPSVSGKTIGAGSYIYLEIELDDTLTNQSIDLWGVQLEAGSVATPFKRNANSIQAELAACQRYYWQPTTHTSFTAYSFSSTLTYCTVNLPVTMRATPTFTLTNADLRISTPSGDLIPSATASVLTSNSSIMFSATNTYTAGRGALMFPASDTAIKISAEL